MIINTQIKYLVLSGLSFLAAYFFYDLAFNIWSIFAFIQLALMGVIVLILTVQSIIKRNRIAMIIGLAVIVVVAVNEILKSELLKSEKVLEASLIDDLSSIHLILRKNQEFEIRSRYYFGPDDIFTGSYEIQDSKIIFHDPPFDNDLIPDTVLIDRDKICLRRNKQGKPDYEFAAYFQITSNQLRNGALR